MSTGDFPLEPLRKVRGLRLDRLETALRACREQWTAAERRREQAAEHWEQSVRQRQVFAEASWRELFDQGAPSGEAMRRHERHLAWLDQLVLQRQAELEQRTRVCEEASRALELAAAAWRQAHSKLDALGELKQAWLQQSRTKQQLREEQALEELMLRRNPLG